MSLPRVSCYCATYGRPWALEESIASFLRQDYPGEKELIVLNDYSGHTLHCDAPGVKVYNVKAQIIPLGRKFNRTVELCTGDILLPWEDDDIFLSNRISYTVEHMKNGFFHTHLAFFELARMKLKISGNHYHCNMGVTKVLFEECGRYVELDQCDLDVRLMQLLKRKSGHKGYTIANKDIFYVYRWGSVGSYHGSGWGLKKEKECISSGAAKVVDAQMKKGKVPLGDYDLVPRWSYDYEAVAKELVNDA